MAFDFISLLGWLLPVVSGAMAGVVAWYCSTRLLALWGLPDAFLARTAARHGERPVRLELLRDEGSGTDIVRGFRWHPEHNPVLRPRLVGLHHGVVAVALFLFIASPAVAGSSLGAPITATQLGLASCLTAVYALNRQYQQLRNRIARSYDNVMSAWFEKLFPLTSLNEGTVLGAINRVISSARRAPGGPRHIEDNFVRYVLVEGTKAYLGGASARLVREKMTDLFIQAESDLDTINMIYEAMSLMTQDEIVSIYGQKTDLSAREYFGDLPSPFSEAFREPGIFYLRRARIILEEELKKVKAARALL